MIDILSADLVYKPFKIFGVGQAWGNKNWAESLRMIVANNGFTTIMVSGKDETHIIKWIEGTKSQCYSWGAVPGCWKFVPLLRKIVHLYAGMYLYFCHGTSNQDNLRSSADSLLFTEGHMDAWRLHIAY